jgi:sarcosine oxidase subunit beta
MRTADVVIIGAGVMGASTAYHLALRGCRNVLVLERERRSGLGSTGKASGGFRAQFTTDVCVRLSRLARDKLLRFHDEIGMDPGYRPVGYLFMARTAAQLRTLRAALAVQRAAGLAEVREVTPEDILRLSPSVRPDGWVGGTFCPTDGYIVPIAIMRGYLDAAARLGVTFEYGTGDVDVIVNRDADRPRVVGIRAGAGTVATRAVVNAAGPRAGVLARRAGVVVPVTPLRRQTAATHPFPRIPDDTPMTINVDDGFHFRVRDGRTILLWPEDTPGADPFDTTFDPRWLAGALAHAHQCVPCLRETALDPDHYLCGLYEMSPDKHAILGPAPELEGFYLINGSSGHGVMHSPALGQLLAEMILDGEARTLDVRALRPSRFAEGDLNRDTSVL